MLAGCFSLWQANINLMLVVLFFYWASNQHFLAPSNMPLFPSMLKSNELLAANAQVGMGTFVSILLGTLIGGWLVTEPRGQCSWVHSLFWWRLLAGLAAAKYQKHRQRRLTQNTASHLIRSKKPR